MGLTPLSFLVMAGGVADHSDQLWGRWGSGLTMG